MNFSKKQLEEMAEVGAKINEVLENASMPYPMALGILEIQKQEIHKRVEQYQIREELEEVFEAARKKRAKVMVKKVVIRKKTKKR